MHFFVWNFRAAHIGRRRGQPFAYVAGLSLVTLAAMAGGSKASAQTLHVDYSAPNTNLSSGVTAYNASNLLAADAGFQINSGATVSFGAGNQIHLGPGFRAVAGSSFRARIAALSPTPSFSPAPSIYATAQNVTITAGGATVRYTLDGSTPTSASTLYTGPITVSTTATVKAVAFVSSYLDSFVSSGAYTIGNAILNYIREYIRIGDRVIAIETTPQP